MMEELLSAVARALQGAAGETCPVYVGRVEQGLRPPCFLLVPLETVRTPLGQGRYLTRYRLDIHGFPDPAAGVTELYLLGEKLLTAVETVTLPDGDRLRGRGARCEVTDGVLHCFVGYEVIARPADEGERMGELTHGVGV